MKINKKRTAIISIILFILLFSSITIYYMQKSNKNYISASNCEIIGDTTKKQECLIGVAERIASYNLKKSIDLCNKINDSTIRDICFFQVARKVDFRNYNVGKGDITCESVNNSIWQNYCNRNKIHPHLT